MSNPVFILGKPVDMEESLTCEFKEVKANPVQTIGKKVDEYVMAFLNETPGSIFWGSPRRFHLACCDTDGCGLFPSGKPARP